MNQNFFSNLTNNLNSSSRCKVSIPMANDEACAFAVCKAVKMGFLSATLIGNTKQIEDMYGEIARHENVSILEETDEKAACALAVKEVKEHRCDILMKGHVATSSILKAVLNSKTGIRKNPILSHLTFFEFPQKPGLRILTDAAIIISPDIETLRKEILNAAEAFSLFEKRPAKVALLAANEKISEKVPSTVMASKVAEAMKEQNNVIVEGPISFDLSVSTESAQKKKYSGLIQGDADIFVAPRIETGNAFYKALQYFVKADMGGLVYGAQCPVVLTSRADDNNTKLNSLLLGIALWQRAKTDISAISTTN